MHDAEDHDPVLLDIVDQQVRRLRNGELSCAVDPPGAARKRLLLKQASPSQDARFGSVRGVKVSPR